MIYAFSSKEGLRTVYPMGGGVPFAQNLRKTIQHTIQHENLDPAEDVAPLSYPLNMCSLGNHIRLVYVSPQNGQQHWETQICGFGLQFSCQDLLLPGKANHWCKPRWGLNDPSSANLALALALAAKILRQSLLPSLKLQCSAPNQGLVLGPS